MHRNTPILGLHASDIRREGSCVEDGGAPDLDRPVDVGMESPRPYVGGEGPDLVVNLSNLPCPPYDPVLIRNLRSISSMTAVLVDERQGIRLEKFQTLYYSFSSDLG